MILSIIVIQMNVYITENVQMWLFSRQITTTFVLE